MSESEGTMPPDLQEALSIRYAVGLRLALLSSGNWAIWCGDQLTIHPGLEMRQLEEIAKIERFQRECAWEEYVRRQAAGWEAPQTVKASKTLEDMGL